MKPTNDSSPAQEGPGTAIPRPSRRGLLAAGVAGGAGLSTLALWKRGLRARGVRAAEMPRLSEPRIRGASAHLIPNTPVVSHEGEELLFYDDLVHDRVVTINFFSTRGDEIYPVVDKLVEVQRLLARRMGKDLFMVSITTDPAHDTPELLADFAREKGAGPGWTFVSGGARELGFLRSFLFVRRPFVTGAPLQGNHGPCCSVGMARYGNERLCQWASFPLKISAGFIATRFDWIGFREGDAPSHA